MKPKLLALSTLAGGETLYELLECVAPVFASGPWALSVEEEGKFRLPEVVLHTLSLGPNDLLALQRNAISVRLDLYREVLESVESVKGVGDWRCVEQFLSRPLTSVQPDGSVPIPADLMKLTPGDRLVLEVVREGIGHALYLYLATSGGDSE